MGGIGAWFVTKSLGYYYRGTNLFIMSYIWVNQQHNGPNWSPKPLNMALSEVYFAIIKELRTKRAENFWSGRGTWLSMGGGQPLHEVHSPRPHIGQPYRCVLRSKLTLLFGTRVWSYSVLLVWIVSKNIFLDLLLEGMAGAGIEKCSVYMARNDIEACKCYESSFFQIPAPLNKQIKHSLRPPP